MEPWRIYGSVVLDSHHNDKELDADPQPCWRRTVPSVLRIRIRRIRTYVFGHTGSGSGPIGIRGMDLDPDPSIIERK
jgi:hypothetical protein